MKWLKKTMNKTVTNAIYLAIGLLIAGIFITAATNWIGTGQDNIITEVKKVESY
ncbi:hypothetical protein [Paenibacillus ihuae]|uniref:hypothetical protein n=1 Tax=Paenibacillus ihuae TaxID=1232431 RepID=UPI000A7B3777|nr:hypothetical protein [Paenibacillus ihuae]